MSIAILSHPDCLLHADSNGHPEQPDRIKVIEQTLKNSKIKDQLQFFLAPEVLLEQLYRVHNKNYVKTILEIAPKKGIVNLDLDTFMNEYTLPAALRAAGGAVNAVDLIMSKQVKAAFCNVRPPGHHAERARAMGFCIFNNVAVAAAHALEHYKLKRVAIIDFDAHHGNGTENIFQNDKRVLFCSSFQYPFFPFSGIDTKSQHIINIPLMAGTTSREFRSEIEQYWLSAIADFKPQIIFFSAGFDGHYQDPISNMELTELDYAWLTTRIKHIADKCCQGRIVSVLEGGYCLEVLGQCALAHINALI